jgi:adenine-specific DNA-methyltransferase
MPTLSFKGKSVIETYHHTVPHHRLEFDEKLSLLPKGQKPSLDGNLIIEGDNLLALKALLPTHAGKIKCVYIDPPYNTGNEGWVYNDNLTQPQFKEWIGKTVGKEGEDATRHDKWCCMMWPRLELLWELLRTDGVIFISIDDFEFHALRTLMNEVFGYENHIATLVWEKGRKNDARLFSVGHEYMLVFAKSLESLKAKDTIWREAKPGSAELWEQYVTIRKRVGSNDERVETELREWHKQLQDKHPAKRLGRWLHVDKWGPWRDRDISWIGGGGPRYDVVHPKTKKACKVPDRGWGFATPEAMQRQIDLGLVEFREDHTEPPLLKRHLKPRVYEIDDDAESPEDEQDEELAVQVMPSVIYKQSQVAVKYLRKLIGAENFDNPKDYLVLSRLISYCTGSNDVILDSFAGSGTTGQAVLESNKKDGGQRTFILVQRAYDTKADEQRKRNICRTSTRPRLLAAAKAERYEFSFSYTEIGDPLFGEYRDFGKKMPKFEDLAKYIFYTETSRECELKKVDEKTGFIGSTEAAGGTSYYLFYTPNNKEDRELSTETLKALLKKDKNRTWVIYCEKIWLHQDQIRKFEKEHGKTVRPMLVPFNLK